MSGFDVTIKHRFGGHNGIPTEWEISTSQPEACKLIRSLPQFYIIDHSTEEHKDYHSNWIILPEGIHRTYAGEVAACLAMGDRDGLLVALRDCQAQLPRAACVLAVNRYVNGFGILMVSRRKISDGKLEWGLPGGKFEKPRDKDDEDTARNEFREETGLTANHFTRVFEDVCRGQTNYICTTYLATELAGELKAEEGLEVKWDFPKDLLDGPFADYNRRLLQHMDLL